VSPKSVRIKNYHRNSSKRYRGEGKKPELIYDVHSILINDLAATKSSQLIFSGFSMKTYCPTGGARYSGRDHYMGKPFMQGTVSRVMGQKSLKEYHFEIRRSFRYSYKEIPTDLSLPWIASKLPL
jgi:hypothetical protein